MHRSDYLQSYRKPPVGEPAIQCQCWLASHIERVRKRRPIEPVLGVVAGWRQRACRKRRNGDGGCEKEGELLMKYPGLAGNAHLEFVRFQECLSTDLSCVAEDFGQPWIEFNPSMLGQVSQ